MHIFCFGDIAFSATDTSRSVWLPPADLHLTQETRMLFNFELPVGDRLNPTPRSRGPRLLAHVHSVRAVQSWAPGFAALATNHILDAGEEGLKTTINALHQAGFQTVGAGHSADEIRKPLFWETNQGRLVIINWVFPETNPEWLAIPGPHCWPGVEAACEQIHNLKNQAEWVFVFAHWSDELFGYPRPEDRQVGQALAQAGADMVVGHHPHVVRGMEVFGGCPVFYSLGNFYFSNISDNEGGWINREAPRNLEGLGVRVTFEKGKKPEYQALSYWNAGDRVIRDRLNRAVRRMEALSRPLQQYQDAGYAMWYDIQRARFNRWGYRWHFKLRQLGLAGLVRYIAQKGHILDRPQVRSAVSQGSQVIRDDIGKR